MIRKLKNHKYATIALKEAISQIALNTDMSYQSCWNNVKRKSDNIYKLKYGTRKPD